ncbi:hypothetical protein HAX54_053459, partial [Datura stramonium]|nr:hypothetical protein [Datura stramonium]
WRTKKRVTLALCCDHCRATPVLCTRVDIVKEEATRDGSVPCCANYATTIVPCQ